MLEYAELLGWLCYHTRDSRGSQPGFPDLVLVRGPRCLFIELKTDHEKPDPDQLKWLDALRAVPTIEVDVWRPRDWPSIELLLRRAPATLR